jgi:hypothetical protein
MESIAEQITELQELVARADALQNSILQTLRREEERWRDTQRRTNEAMGIIRSLRERSRVSERERMEERFIGRRCFRVVRVHPYVRRTSADSTTD